MSVASLTPSRIGTQTSRWTATSNFGSLAARSTVGKKPRLHAKTSESAANVIRSRRVRSILARAARPVWKFLESRRDPNPKFMVRTPVVSAIGFRKGGRRWLRSGVGHFDHQFAVVFSLEELEERVGKCLESLHDIFLRLELSGSHPADHVAGGLSIAGGVIEDDKP